MTRTLLDQLADEIVGSGESIEDALDREARQLLLERELSSLVPMLDELTVLDLTDRPYAQILVGMVAHHSVPKQPEVTTRMLDSAEATLAERGEPAGEALAAWARGNVRLAFGDLPGASNAWRRAVELDPDSELVEDLALANLAYGSFCVDGDLVAALELAEAAVRSSAGRGDGRGEGLGLVYEGYLRVHAGQFEAAQQAFERAGANFASASPAPYEWPLAFAGQGAVAGMRGQAELADQAFLDAILLSRQMDNTWFEAIARTLRADHTLRLDSRRAHADCRFAQRVFDRLGDSWWASAVRRVRADAALASGEIEAARLLTARLLPMLDNPVERARCLITAGKAHLRAGDDVAAAAAADEAVTLIEGTGADFFLVQALFLVAQCEPWRAPEAIERARSLSTDDAAYQELWATRPTLRVHLLGRQSVQVGDDEVTFRTSRAEHLVMMLALASGRAIDVGQVAEALWPDARSDKLPSNLSTATYDARQALGSEAWRLHRTGSQFWLDLDGASVDLDDAMRRARGIRPLHEAEPSDKDAAAQSRLAAVAELRREILPTLIFEPWVDAANRRRQSFLELLDAGGT